MGQPQPQPVGAIRLTLLSDGNLQVEARMPGDTGDVLRVLAQAQLAVLDAARKPRPVIEVARALPGVN